MNCPDCESRRQHMLAMLMVLTLVLTSLVLFDYIGKASSIEAYNNLSKECNMKISQANHELAKCPVQRETYVYPIINNMNCTWGGFDG